jgi:hypothetical protein
VAAVAYGGVCLRCSSAVFMPNYSSFSSCALDALEAVAIVVLSIVKLPA